ncbi:MAG TPA: hypothetical protein DIU00_01995 [Phycisphaerales bacterium]|nr:hypothetical protein [Phycisphaerales bacterium]
MSRRSVKVALFRFSPKDLVLIAVLGGSSVVLAGVTVQPLTAMSAGLLPPTFWAGMSFQFFAVLIRFLVGRHGTNTLVGIVVGALGIFLLPIGFFALVACPLQGLIHDVMFAVLRQNKPTSSWKSFLAAGIANACFTFIVMSFFFGKTLASPLVWWVPLTCLSGGVLGLIGYLTAKRIVRLAPQWAPED